jgi:hypothetical protein
MLLNNAFRNTSVFGMDTNVKGNDLPTQSDPDTLNPEHGSDEMISIGSTLSLSEVNHILNDVDENHE